MSELQKVIGAVEVITPDAKGFYKIQIKGKLYSTGAKTAPDCAVGQTVEFTPEAKEWTGRDGKKSTFYNVAEGTLKVVTAPSQATPGAAQTQAPRSAGGMSKDDYWFNKEQRDLANEAKREITQQQIQQQAARNAAIEFTKILSDQDAIVYGKAPADGTPIPRKKKLEVIEATVDHYTAKFLREVQAVGVVEVAENGENEPVVSGEDD